MNSDPVAPRHRPESWRAIVAIVLAVAGPGSWTGRAAPAALGAAGDVAVEALARRARESVVIIRQYGRDGGAEGVGSGFVVSSNGLIATSLHVIGEARSFTVQLSNGKKLEPLAVEAWDRHLDLAVIRVASSNLAALPLGGTNVLPQGAPVIAMGNPMGLELSVVRGVVSARREVEGVEMIQLALPVEPGNSGGPLLDAAGQVQGIVSLKSALTANLAFATPVEGLRKLLLQPNPVRLDRWLSLGALSPAEWTPVFGARWTQRGGRILVESAGRGFGGRALCLAGGTPPVPPYEVSVSVRLDDESGAAGLTFGSDGGDHHYGWYPSGGQLRLTRFDGPDVFSWNILRQTPSAAYLSGEWNRLTVRVLTNRLECLVNGQEVASVPLDDPVEGRVGLAKFRETRASFKGFQVQTNLAILPATNRLAAGLPDDAELRRRTKPLGSGGRRWLEEQASSLEQEALRLRRLAQSLHREMIASNLVQQLAQPEDGIDLALAALWLARLDQPELDPEAYRRRLSAMGSELAGRIPAGADDAARLEALSEYLFRENGFHGSRHDYYNRANSYLSDVLDDREGIPITLAVLYLDLAGRIGVTNVFPVAMPGHFLVGHGTGRDARFLDVFDGGRVLNREAAAALARKSSGVDPEDEEWVPPAKRQIVVRMVRNLIRSSSGTGQPAAALPYVDLLVALEPESMPDRWTRATLRISVGDRDGARSDLRWLLDKAPEELDLERVRELLRSL